MPDRTLPLAERILLIAMYGSFIVGILGLGVMAAALAALVVRVVWACSDACRLKSS